MVYALNNRTKNNIFFGQDYDKNGKVFERKWKYIV